jgi:asparagine synthase (glutamine-hydrolysing)
VRGREEELCEELRHRLLEAVRLRMISDVPLGAFLSGGIDSSAVVAFMCQLSGRAVQTFSIGFEEDEYNELPYARRVARLFETDHHEFVVKPNAVNILPELVWYYNEPYADSSALPTYYLSKLAREYVTVALNGDAGDESFAGYEAYRSMQRAQRLNRLPVWVRRGLAQAARLVPDSLPHEHLLRRGKRFIDHPLEDLYRKYGRGISCFTDEMKAGTYTEEFYARVGELDSLSPALDVLATTDASDPVEAVQDLDVNLTLPDDLLVKVDIASMAHGLEARSPLCDHLVMEFAASLPSRLKLHRGTGKYLFKKAMAGILPDEVIQREKRGFGVPLDRWFRGELRELVEETLLSRRAIERGYFQPTAVRRLIQEHVSGHARWHHQLWALLMLELWHRMFIDKTLSPPGA